MLDEEHTEKLAKQLADRTLAQIIVETGLLVLIALTSLVGNSCVLYVFYKTPHLRSVTSYYIITLAIADVIMASTVMPINIAVAAVGELPQVIDSKVAKILSYVAFGLMVGSTQTTTLIAVNRFFCVVKPSIYRKIFKPKPAMILLLGFWLFSIFIVVLPCLSGMAEFKLSPGSVAYLLIFHDLRVVILYNTIVVLVSIWIPLSVTAVSYWKIYKVVTGHNAVVLPSLNTGPSNNSSSLTNEDIHITRSLLALVNRILKHMPREVEMVYIYFAFLSSAINPILFNLFNRPFRKEFLRVIFHIERE
ncbi:hypothetical protein QZH41_014607 [Actinostola sp. cb2023]|nr:hypothetical protein QZH41_014607 [Actinostola sp. cb2023]